MAHLRKFPEQSARLLINGQEAALLNEFAVGGANWKKQEMTIRISGKMLQSGRNAIELVPGRGKAIDDIGLFRVVVSGRAE
jgi:hypothetical protein